MNGPQVDRRNSGLGLLTLFSTTGTLICCALPITLVSLGLGSAVASLTSALPFLIVLTRHKTWIFLLSASMLLLAGWSIFRRDHACSSDPRIGQTCSRLQTWNRRIYWTSVAIWTIGFAAAYAALPLARWLAR